MGNLSTNFDTAEPGMTCQCGCGFGSKPEDFNEHLVELAQGVRTLVRRPLTVNSAARCLKHNAKEGGVKESAHTPHPQRGSVCCAMDIATAGGLERWELVAGAVVVALVQAGHLEAAAAGAAFHDIQHIVCGIGVASTFVHLDVDDSGVLPRPGVWRYR